MTHSGGGNHDPAGPTDRVLRRGLDAADTPPAPLPSFPGLCSVESAGSSAGEPAPQVAEFIRQLERKGKSVRFRSGKVRDIIEIDDVVVIVASDRISAYDRVLGYAPARGIILSSLSSWWFERTRDVVDNHLIGDLTPRAVVARRAPVLPVEFVVRGYLTGSAWRDYEAGRAVSGVRLAEGLRFNERLAQPILTPSTKAETGHDEPISTEEIVARGLLTRPQLERIEEKALALFRHGSEVAAGNGLILVDTKYEFALVDEQPVVVDEIHTPDSSRYWYADSYEEDFAAGRRQRKLDKEYLRQWLADRGFTGDGEVPPIPQEVFAEVTSRYARAYERITGLKIDLSQKANEFGSHDAEIRAILEKTQQYLA